MLIYGVQPQPDGTFLITGSPDTTRYQALHEAMQAAGRLNSQALDEAYASMPDPDPAMFDGDGDLIRRARHQVATSRRYVGDDGSWRGFRRSRKAG
jgi:hypothetical protein